MEVVQVSDSLWLCKEHISQGTVYNPNWRWHSVFPCIQEKSPLASEVINLRNVKDEQISANSFRCITEDCVGTGLQSSEEQTSRNISLNKTPRLWYGVKLLKLLEADCSLQATGRFLLFISDLLISSLLFKYHIATPIATWQLTAWKLLLLLEATSLPVAERKQGGWLLSMNSTLWGYLCSHTKMLTYLLTLCRGVARHCNYLGDILVAFSFSLPCGMRYTTLSMPECLTIFDRWFFGHPPGKFLYMSQNLYLFACENHQYSGKIEKPQLVGDFVHFSATKSHAGGY